MLATGHEMSAQALEPPGKANQITNAHGVAEGLVDDLLAGFGATVLLLRFLREVGKERLLLLDLAGQRLDLLLVSRHPVGPFIAVLEGNVVLRSWFFATKSDFVGFQT